MQTLANGIESMRDGEVQAATHDSAGAGGEVREAGSDNGSGAGEAGSGKDLDADGNEDAESQRSARSAESDLAWTRACMRSWPGAATGATSQTSAIPIEGRLHVLRTFVASLASGGSSHETLFIGSGQSRIRKHRCGVANKVSC